MTALRREVPTRKYILYLMQYRESTNVSTYLSTQLGYVNIQLDDNNIISIIIIKWCPSVFLYTGYYLTVFWMDIQHHLFKSVSHLHYMNVSSSCPTIPNYRNIITLILDSGWSKRTLAGFITFIFIIMIFVSWKWIFDQNWLNIFIFELFRKKMFCW